MWNGLWRRDGTQSHPGGADSKIYDPQPIIDLLGFPHIHCGEISILGLVVYVSMDSDAGMGPYRPQMMVTLGTILGQ